MTNIRETITTSLQSAGYGQYTSYAAPVIEALEQREAQAVEVLTSYAVGQGLSFEQIRPVLEEAGLVEPLPEPEPVGTVAGGMDEDSLSLTAQVAHLANIVERLVQAAASRGLRI